MDEGKSLRYRVEYNNIKSTGYRQKGHENREALGTRLRQLSSFGKVGENGGKILVSFETTTQGTTTAI